MAIKITIEISDSDVHGMFTQNAPWYGRLLGAVGIVNKKQRVAEKIKDAISSNLCLHGVTPQISINEC